MGTECGIDVFNIKLSISRPVNGPTFKVTINYFAWNVNWFTECFLEFSSKLPLSADTLAASVLKTAANNKQITALKFMLVKKKSRTKNAIFRELALS